MADLTNYDNMSETEEKKSFSVLVREKIGEWISQYFNWLKFRPNQSFPQKLLHVFTRTVVSIIVIAFSPIVFVILLVAFVAAG